MLFPICHTCFVPDQKIQRSQCSLYSAITNWPNTIPVKPVLGSKSRTVQTRSSGSQKFIDSEKESKLFSLLSFCYHFYHYVIIFVIIIVFIYVIIFIIIMLSPRYHCYHYVIGTHRVLEVLRCSRPRVLKSPQNVYKMSSGPHGPRLVPFWYHFVTDFGNMLPFCYYFW